MNSRSFPLDVYIAGPISKGGTLLNVHRACGVWAYLQKCGIVATCPHWSALQDMICPLPWDEWIAYDMHLIPLHKCVLRLPGESAGADRETAEAARLGIPVFHSVVEVRQFLGV
jgi:hypothetical protein